MPYNQEISRATPGYIVILIDQSFSMGYPFGKAGTKAKECANAVNGVLRETVLACTDGDEIKNSCDISVLGYGKLNSAAVNAFSGDLASKSVVTIQDLTESCLRVETVTRKVSDGAGDFIEIEDQFPIWIESVAVGETPMTAGFRMARQLVSDWIKEHQTSFPPVIINITDGEANSLANAKSAAEELMQLKTDDGNVILLNAHISGATDQELVLPAKKEQLPTQDSNAEFLFDISSELPLKMLERASAAGLNPTPYARGFIYQAKLDTLVQMLEIGTKAEFG